MSLKIINILLFLIGFFGLSYIKIYSMKQLYNNNIIIQNIELENLKSNYYIGYIEIENLKIKVPIVYGTSKKELDQNVVGISNYSNSSHIILAGHAIETVFKPLYNISIKTKIKVKLNNIYKYYEVDYIDNVSYDNISIYKNSGLTLITCIDKKTRLIVHAKTA